MRWLLDTCAISELVRRHPEPRVVEWVRTNMSACALAMPVLGELQYGIEKLIPGRMRNALQVWFDTIERDYEGRILAVDDRVWSTWARLKASMEAIGRPRDDLDLLIAATAAAHGVTLVTRNTKHFEDTGVKLHDPWT